MCSPVATAATCTTATTGGSWNTAGNWTCTSGGNHVPLATDDVVINRNFTVNTTTAAVLSVTMTAGTLTQSSVLNIATNGTLSLQGGTWNSTANMIIGGPATFSGGTFNPTSNSTRTFSGLVTISGGSWIGTTRAVTFRGGITFSSGTFTAGTGVHTFDTNNQNITGTVSIPSVTVTGITLTNNGTFTIATALAGTGTILNTSYLAIGDNAIPAAIIDASTPGNTVEYNRAGTQTLAPVDYQNLILSNTSAKTMTNITSIAGDLTLSGSATMTGNAAFTLTGALNYGSSGSSTLTAATPISIGTFSQTAGTFTANNNAITVTGTGAGTWSKSGTFSPGTGTVIFTGAAPQIGASNFGNLTINVGSGNTATLNGNITTSLALTVNANTTLDTSTFTAGVTGNFVVNGTVAGTGAITLNGAANIDGTGSVTDTTNLTISTGARSVLSTADLSFSGPITVTGVTVTNNGTITSTAATGITGTGTWVNSTNSTLNVSGTLTPTTLTASASGNTVNYAGAAQTVKLPSGAPATYYNLTLSGSGAKAMPATVMTVSNIFTLTGTASSTLAANVTVGGNLVVSTNGGTLDLSTFTANRSAAGGTINVQDSATLKIGGTNTFPSNYSTHTLTSASTVEYSGTTQTVTAETYGNLTLSGSNNKTIGTAAGQTVTIAGDLSVVAGTYLGSTNNPTVNLQGNFSNTGTFTSGSGIFSFSGTAAAAQTVSGTPTFASLRINNTGSPGGVTMNSNVTAGTLLTLNAGIITTGSNTLITSANCPGSISRTGTGHVAGFLQLKVPAGTSTCVHHVGDSTTYRPISITFPSTTTTGNLTGSVSQSAGDHPNIGTSSLDSAQSVNRYWTLTNGGVGLGGGGYSITLNFVAGDVDGNADPTTFEIQRWGGASWSAPETVGTDTTTSAQATGVTGFSDFAAGQRRLNNFLVGNVPVAPVCNPQTLSITARDSSNKTLTNYRGLVTLTTSTAHGDWSVASAGGTLLNGTADDGAATYQFVVADHGLASFKLTNTHPETLTVTVSDGSVNSTSTGYQVDNYKFAITNGPIQVAGRNQAMSVQLNCVGVDTGYTGSRNLKGWVTLDADDPGGSLPSINAVTLPSATPGANNLSLTFASGVANFNLATTDVGKYSLNLSDTNRNYATATDITGTSSTITTRPFAIVVSAIKQGSTNNPGGTATSGSKFIVAADTFQATVGAYKWNAAADGGTGSDGLAGDGVPDAGATLAQVTGGNAAPSYRWTTTLTAASPYTPATGTLAGLSNGVQSGTCPAGSPNCFSSGVATPTNLSYSDVGSFTLNVKATGFLNTAGVNFDSSVASSNAIVFDNSGGRSAVVGRFYPDHFTLTASSLTPACAAGSFTYMGDAHLAYTFGIEARNKSDVITGNYFASGYTTGTVSLQAENNNNGTDIGSRLTAPTSSWSAGAYNFSTSAATFSRPGSPDGPFDSLQVGVTVNDADGAVLASRDMNPTTTGACLPATTCTGKSIGTTIVRFGRLTIGNVSGSAALPLTVPVEAQYWNGTAFITNTLDACTSVAASTLGSDIAMGSYSTGLNPAPNCKTAISNGGTLASGRKSLRLSAPTGQASGNVTLTVNLGAVASGSTCTTSGALPGTATTANRPYLQSGSGFSQNPSGRATFGVYRGSEEQIHRQENF